MYVSNFDHRVPFRISYNISRFVQHVLYSTSCTERLVQNILYKSCFTAGLSGPLVDASHVCFTEDTDVVRQGPECLDGEWPGPVVLGQGEGEGGAGGGGGGDGGGGGGGGN